VGGCLFALVSNPKEDERVLMLRWNCVHLELQLGCRGVSESRFSWVCLIHGKGLGLRRVGADLVAVMVH
jgi:hypothetical protein